jgi:transcriptional regulator with XRE-family HTH domain
MKTRIEQLIDKEQLTPSKLADLVGVQRSSISHILSGRNNPSLDFVQKILVQFKNINSDWLLFGKGEMYKTKLPSLFEQNSQPQKVENQEKIIDKSETEVKDLKENSEVKKESKKVETKIEVQNTDVNQPDQIVIFFSDKTFAAYKPK